MAASWGSNGRFTVNAPAVCGTTPLLNALSGISPVSHIMVPRGWTIRKHGVTILDVANSPGLNPIESPFATVIFPQSRTYSRSDLGGAGLRVCALAEGQAASPIRAAVARTRCMDRW